MTEYIGYVRQRPRWRFTKLGQVVPPATEPISNGREDGQPPQVRGRKGRECPLTPRWINAIVQWNPTAKAQHQVLDSSRGWAYNAHTALSIDFDGNISGVLERVGAWLRLDALGPNSPIPDKGDLLHVHKMTSVTPTGQLRLMAGGVEAWIPFLINGSAWVHEDDGDFFTQRPEPIFPGGAPADLAGYAAVVLKGSVVRQSPGGVKIYVVSTDTIVRVISESQGWAKIGEKRWVDLGRVRALAN